MVIGGFSGAQNTNAYTFATTTSGASWTLTHAGGELVETVTTNSLDNGGLMTTYTRGATGAAPLSVEQDVKRPVGGILLLVSRTQDPAGAALTTHWTYTTNALIDTVVHPDGSWERYTYDSGRRPLSIASPLGNADTNALDSACRVIVNSYAPVDPLEDTASSRVAWLSEPRTITEYVAGIPVRRSYRALYFTAGNEKVDIEEQACSSGAAYGAVGNLRTKRTWYAESANAPSSERIRQVIRPDGLQDDYTYETGSYSTNGAPADWSFTASATGVFVRVTVTHGTADAPAGIAGKTTREVSIEDPFRRVLRQETWVYQGGSSYACVAWTATSLDDLGRPTAVRRSDGSLSETTWGCCGKESETDAAGGVTGLSYDALKRPVMTVREGVAASGDWPAQPDRYTLTAYDALARRLSETVTDAAGLSLTSSNVYDNAGRLIRSVDAAGLVTTHAFDPANRTETVTLPGGATRITTRYRDGRTASVTGTAATAQYYAYGVNADGTEWTLTVQGTLPATLQPPPATSPWSRTVTDFLGRTLLEERPAFGGGSLVTSNAYSSVGRLVATTVSGDTGVLNRTLYVHDELGNQIASAQDLDLDGVIDYTGPDRVQGADTCYLYTQSAWWRQNASWICALPGSALATTTSVQRTRLTGLGQTSALGLLTSESVSLDIQGNRTTSRTVVDRANRLAYQLVDTPASSIDVQSVSRNGLVQSRRTATGLNTTFVHDGLGRQTGTTDPRMGTSIVHYDTRGWVDYVRDAATFQTSYGYAADTGRRVSTTDPLSHTVLTAYDLQGHVVTNWGATYPVAYEYSSHGRMTGMWTWRNTSEAGDKTSWLYEEATGLLTNKLYADNKGTSYTYTPDGKLATRTWARGVTTTYSYTNGADLAAIHYSDGTPDVSFLYDRLGRPIRITDGSGTRALAYDTHLRLAAETNSIAGLVRRYDTLGREIGFDLGDAYSVRYAFDNVGRFASLTSDVGSLTSSATYSYIPDADLIAGVTNTFGAITIRSYEPHRPLITQVRNTIGSERVISQYGYQNDAAGRRTSIANSGEAFRAITNTCDLAAFNAYAYNERGEVTGAVRYWGTNTADTAAPVSGQAYGYVFDSIGNRISAAEGDATRTASYTANPLNQYTQRQVPDQTDIIGTANTNTTITVNDRAVTRQGAYWHDVFPVDNTAAAVYSQAVVRAVYNPPSTNAPDVVSAATGRVFVARTPEQFAYDLDGNLLSDGRLTYTWDAENRLITVATRTDLPAVVPRVRLQHAYDYMSRRFRTVSSFWTNGAWQVSATNLFAYDQWNLIHERSDRPTVQPSDQFYIWGLDLSGTLHGAGRIGGLLSEVRNPPDSTQPSVFALFYDANGNVSELIGADNTIAAHYEYGPFGQTVVQTGPVAAANPFRFSTKYYDSASATYYYGALPGLAWEIPLVDVDCAA